MLEVYTGVIENINNEMKFQKGCVVIDGHILSDLYTVSFFFTSGSKVGMIPQSQAPDT